MSTHFVNKSKFKHHARPDSISTSTCVRTLAGASTCAACTGPPANSTFQQAANGTTSDACPWVCNSGFFPAQVDVGGSSMAGCLPCTNAPPGAMYSGPGTSQGGGICPWQCLPGYFRTSVPQEFCAPCRTGTYSTATGEAPHSHSF
jgi:hypothetical protein